MRLKKINTATLTICVLFFISAAIVFGIFRFSIPDYRLEVFRIKGGYGYQIKKSDKIIIYQPVIPAIGEEKPFASAREAQDVGTLVRKRLEKGMDISITVSELRQLNIE